MKEVISKLKVKNRSYQNAEKEPAQESNFLIKDGIFIRHKGNLIKIKWEDIMWLKGDGNYTTLITKDQVYSLRNILKEFESVLPKDEFYRIHKSYIVRLDAISSINAKEVLVGDDAVPVGRTYFQDLINGIPKLSSVGSF